MREFLKLEDVVFEERSESFHWRMTNCLEYMYRGILLRETGLESDYAFQEGTCLVEETISYWKAGFNDIEVLTNNSYKYNLNSFVAVKRDCKHHECPFWIGESFRTSEDDVKTVRSLQVHWFEQFGRRSGMCTKFAPLCLSGKRRPKKVL